MLVLYALMHHAKVLLVAIGGVEVASVFMAISVV